MYIKNKFQYIFKYLYCFTPFHKFITKLCKMLNAVIPEIFFIFSMFCYETIPFSQIIIFKG